MLICVFALSATTILAQDSSSPPNFAASVTENDLKEFQKVLADRDSYKKSSEEAVKQRDEWKESAKNWQKQYEDAKYRADVTQENRITNLENSLKSANSAITGQREIISSYKDETERLRRETERIKKREVKVALASFGLGAGAGGMAGWQMRGAFNF